jgi:hypothetical protein
VSSTVVLAASALSARLEPAARGLGAAGVAVWVPDRDGRYLEVLATYGYSELFLAGVGAIPIGAPVMTALAFRDRSIVVRPRRPGHAAALAVPIIGQGQLVGVLTVQFDSAIVDVPGDAVADAEMLASQMALLVLTAVPKAGPPAPLDRRQRATDMTARRAPRLAPVRPIPTAMAAAIERAGMPRAADARLAGAGPMCAEAFVATAREVLRVRPASLGLVHGEPNAMPDFVALFADVLSGDDLVGRYSETELVVLMPDTASGLAATRIEKVLDAARAAGLGRASAGVTASGTSRAWDIEPLLAQAGAALAAAEVQGRPLVLYGSGGLREAAAGARR